MMMEEEEKNEDTMEMKARLWAELTQQKEKEEGGGKIKERLYIKGEMDREKDREE